MVNLQLLGVRKVSSLGNFQLQFSRLSSSKAIPYSYEIRKHSTSNKSFDLLLPLLKTSPLFLTPPRFTPSHGPYLIFDSTFLQKLTCSSVSLQHSVFSPVLLLSRHFRMVWLLPCISDQILCFGKSRMRTATSSGTAHSKHKLSICQGESQELGRIKEQKYHIFQFG